MQNMTSHYSIISLDIGDRWIGVAICDPLGFFARPLTTIQAPELKTFIAKAIEQYKLQTIVVGYPKTLRTHSEQTIKVLALFDELKKRFSDIEWTLQDERLSSKYASSIKKEKTKEDRLHSHAIAAASILQDYLEGQRFLKEIDEARRGP
jgi:putative holliday junction resolvase